MHTYRTLRERWGFREKKSHIDKNCFHCSLQQTKNVYLKKYCYVYLTNMHTKGQFWNGKLSKGKTAINVAKELSV